MLLHVLQPCLLQAEARLQHWPIWTTLADKFKAYIESGVFVFVLWGGGQLHDTCCMFYSHGAEVFSDA